MLLNVPLDTIDQWHQERRTRPALAGRPITATPTTGMTAKADSASRRHAAPDATSVLIF